MELPLKIFFSHVVLPIIVAVLILSFIKKFPDIWEERSPDSIFTYSCLKLVENGHIRSMCKSTKAGLSVKAKPIDAPAMPHHVVEVLLEKVIPEPLTKNQYVTQCTEVGITLKGLCLVTPLS